MQPGLPLGGTSGLKSNQKLFKIHELYRNFLKPYFLNQSYNDTYFGQLTALVPPDEGKQE